MTAAAPGPSASWPAGSRSRPRGAVVALAGVADRLPPWRSRLEAVGRALSGPGGWSGPAASVAAEAVRAGLGRGGGTRLAVSLAALEQLHRALGGPTPPSRWPPGRSPWPRTPASARCPTAARSGYCPGRPPPWRPTRRRRCASARRTAARQPPSPRRRSPRPAAVAAAAAAERGSPAGRGRACARSRPSTTSPPGSA